MSELRRITTAWTMLPATLIDHALDTFSIIEADGTIRYESPSVERILGYRPEELVGRNAFELIHPDDRPHVLEIFRERITVPGPSPVVEFRLRHRDGSWRVLEGLGNNLLHDPEVAGIVVNSRDITARKQMEERLRHQALHDPLTGLPNRTVFTELVTHHLERAHRRLEASFAILFVDLDRFKSVNDRLGHLAGDRLLVAVAGRLTNCLRPEDVVSRFGGDEFVVLLPDVQGLADARWVARRVQRSLSHAFDLGGERILVTASIGIAMSSARYSLPDEMLRDADAAMYRAKSGGGACTEVFDPSGSERFLTSFSGPRARGRP